MLENRKDSVGLVMEGLNLRKLDEEYISFLESVSEEYGDDIHEAYNYTLNEYFKIDENEPIDEAKVVTFGGKMFPEYGWAVVMAGGAGSGKGFTRNHSIGIDAKVFDVDELKRLTVLRDAKGKNGEKREWNLRDPNQTGEIHQLIKGKGLKDSQEKYFFMGNEGKLPNVIYDITGDDPKKLTSIGKKMKDMGYKTSLVVVVTNREVAFYRNQSRERVVPEVVFHQTHNAVSTQILPYLKGADAKYYDEAWLVFSSANSARDMTPEQEKELKDMGVIKLLKSGSSFVVPQAVEDRVYDVFGPQETNPEDPERYIKYKDYNPSNDKDTAKAQEKRAKKGEISILNGD